MNAPRNGSKPAWWLRQHAKTLAAFTPFVHREPTRVMPPRKRARALTTRTRKVA